MVSTSDEPAGENCESGGLVISYGNDTNNNGVLDEDEITGVEYVCDGNSGEDGNTVLFSTTEEIAGSNCENGGVAISYGVDQNANGTLDADEVETTEYICNGSTGSDGDAGSTGGNGSNALISTVDLEEGSSECPNGGTLVSYGTDSNGNDH